jgi:hypothetical protein
MTSKTKTPHPDIFPSHLTGSPAVTEASHRLAAAIEATEETGKGVREARAAVDAADDEDKAATRAAVAAKDPTPARTLPVREEELRAAIRRDNAARDLAREAAMEFHRALVADREQLVREQAPRIDKARDAAAESLTATVERFEQLATEAGITNALATADATPRESAADMRTRARGRAPIPRVARFDPLTVNVDGRSVEQHLAALRRAVDLYAERAVPLADRILEAVGEGRTRWNSVAETLGVGPVEGEACQTRDALVAEGELVWVDGDGQPIPGNMGLNSRPTAYLERGEPKPSAREARRQRVKAARRKVAA